MTPRSFQTEGLTSKPVMRCPTRWAVRQVTNHGGIGQTLNGPRKTVFCTRESISVLCTTSTPDRTSKRLLPANAPQGLTPRPYPAAGQWLIATVP